MDRARQTWDLAQRLIAADPELDLAVRAMAEVVLSTVESALRDAPGRRIQSMAHQAGEGSYAARPEGVSAAAFTSRLGEQQSV